MTELAFGWTVPLSVIWAHYWLYFHVLFNTIILFKISCWVWCACDDVMTSSSLLNVLCMAIDVAHDHVFVRKKDQRCRRGQLSIWFCTLWDSLTVWRIQNMAVLIDVIFVIKIGLKKMKQLQDICRSYFVHFLWRMFTCAWLCAFEL